MPKYDEQISTCGRMIWKLDGLVPASLKQYKLFLLAMYQTINQYTSAASISFKYSTFVYWNRPVPGGIEENTDTARKSWGRDYIIWPLKIDQWSF